MRVWLVKSGETLPTDGAQTRLFKTGMLADALSRAGHETVWWTTSFDHFKKKFRPEFATSETLEYSPRYIIHALPSVGYKRNVSIRRLFSHYHAAWLFFWRGRKAVRPDVIVASLPTPEMAFAAALLGRFHRTPVVVDIRDLWPDAFVEMFPAWLQPVARVAFFPMRLTVRAALRRASFIVGNTDEYLRWGLARAGRNSRARDRVFPMSYTLKEPSSEEILRANAYWDELGILPGAFNVCFAGSMSQHFDIETVIRAARELEREFPKARFVLCGDGDRLGALRAEAAGSTNIVFPGWVDYAKLWTLFRRCSVGLAPYRNTTNFSLNIPNKPVEYMSAGLPIVSCVSGPLRRLIEENGCGAAYDEGDAVSLKEALRRLYGDPCFREGASRSARQIFDERFESARVNNEFIGYLAEVSRECRT
jgi:glycosyltransferase involved in cell wall biosynthesis